MPLDDYLAGLALFAGTTGAAVAAAGLLVVRRLPHLGAVERVLATGVLGTAAVVGVHLLPGLFGLLSRGSALACALALLAAVAIASRRRYEAAREPFPEPLARGGALARALAALACGALAVWVAATAVWAVAEPSEEIDTLTHHLPNVASWIRSGSFWQVDQFVPLLANGNYPHTGDAVFLAAVLPWMNDAFVKLVNVPFVALTALGVYAVGRELRAPAAASALAGALLASLPVVTRNAYTGAMTDFVMSAGFAAGLAFLLRHARSGRASDLVLAGVGLGIAFGTKWYAVPAVAAVLAVWAGGWLIARRPLRVVVRQGAALAGVVALTGGFWLVRNLVESGNPVFPQEVAVAGATLFSAPHDFLRACAGFSIFDYLGAPGVWRRHLLPAFDYSFAAGGPVALAALAGAGAVSVRDTLAGRRGARRAGAPGAGLRESSGRALALAACAALLAATYAALPYTAFGPEGEPALAAANTRYLLPGLVAAVPLWAWLAGRFPRLGAPLALVAAVAVGDGVRRGFDVPGTTVAATAAALALAAALAWAVAAVARHRAGTRAASAALAGLALVAAVALAAAGHDRQRAFNDGRYEDADPAIVWLVRNAPTGHRVALAGVWGVPVRPAPILPAFGPRLGNEVRYNGVFVDGLLREHTGRAEWARALREGGFDLLIVGRGGYGEECAVPGEETDDDAWARAEGFEPLAGSDRLTLYRVRPR